MLTLHDLTAGSDPLLAYLRPDDAHGHAAARTLTGAQECDPRTLTPEWRRGNLAVLPPDTPSATDPGQLVQTLAQHHAAAAVIAGPGHTLPDADELDALAQAAAAEQLPLLVPTRPAPAAAVVAAVHAAIRRASTAQAQRTESLLRLVDYLYRSGAGPEGLLPHLADVLDAGVYLTTPGDTGWSLLAADGCREALMLARHNGAQPTVVADSGRHITLVPVGSRPPHPVLAGVRAAEAGPWPPHLRQTLTLAATQAALLRHHHELREGEETRRRSRRAHRAGIMQALMLGQRHTALRMAATDSSLHLTGGDAVMAVLACSPRAREQLTRVCEDGLPQTLVAQCPAFPDHVLIAAPAVDSTGHALHTALTGLLAGRRHRGAGISTPVSWERIPHAYAAARQALAAARPGTVTTHSGTADLAAALATVPGATAWARRVVAMATTGDTTRRTDLARLALTAGIPGAASLTNTDRSNIRRDLAEVMVRLGLDHRQMPHRALAELAFQLAALHPGQEHDTLPVVCALTDLLRSAPARDWATATLAPLLNATPPAGGWLGPRTRHPTDRDPIYLLVQYVTSGCSMSATAAALGLSRPATRPRLTAAAAAIGRPITDTRGSGPHPALWALIAGGHLPEVLTPDPIGPLLTTPVLIPHQLATAS